MRRASRRPQPKGNSMKQIPAGTSLTYLRGSAKGSPVALTVHDEKKRLAGLFGSEVVAELRSGIFAESINGVTVPAVAVMVRLDAGRRLLLYGGWINELAPGGRGVLRALASQPEMVIHVAGPSGKIFASATTPNTLPETFADVFVLATRLAKRAAWTEHHFAAARAFVESQYPTPLDLWQQLDAPAKRV
ncbi:MAG: hypothetical protein IAF94_18635 [Pirellulaceae bacterium]|nr:hypothetical protein [Pirellulaceae bacterium]